MMRGETRLPKSVTAKRKVTDWEAIEREYRAGQLSVAEIGRQQGVSHTAINKRAKKDGWSRNLTKAVRQEVAARLVSDEVSTANAREAVDNAAARGVELVRQHRKSLGRAQVVIEKLLAELERGTDNLEEIEDEIEVATKDDKDTKRRNMMLKAVSLPQRAQVAAALSLTIKNVIPLERQAFNLNGEPKPDDPDNEPSAISSTAAFLAESLGEGAKAASSGSR